MNILTQYPGPGDGASVAFGVARLEWAVNALNSGTFNVMTYMTDAQRLDVSSGAGALDVTGAVQLAINALTTAGGGRLYFPFGRYRTVGGFTIPVPALICGDGQLVWNTNFGCSVILCTSNTATLFTFTASVGKFENLALVDIAPARSAGSAIYVTNSDFGTKVDYESIYIKGFYDGLDIAVSNSWMGHNITIINTIHWPIRIRNVVNADAGAWILDTVWIYPADNCPACIRWESSGGGRLVNIFTVPNHTSYVDGIQIDTTGTASVQINISNVVIDRCSGIPLNIIRGYSPLVCTNSTFETDSLTDPAVHLGFVADSYFGDCVLTGGGGAYAITTTTAPRITFGPIRTANFNDLCPSQDTTCRFMYPEPQARGSIPTSGTYAQGDFVRNYAPVLAAGKTLLGWFRLTNGSGHVINVDWAPFYGTNS